jgi:tellurite resistance protein
VALADGSLDSQESYLMRKLASLLQLEPAFLAQARKKAE